MQVAGVEVGEEARRTGRVGQGRAGQVKGPAAQEEAKADHHLRCGSDRLE
jgi:hypothetical protein